jgi:IclR family KDG regulon transcriptional repressor
MMSHIRENRRVNGSVVKALSVLEVFRPEHDQLSAAEIGEATRLSRGSLYPILYALEEYGYLRRLTPRTYTIGFRFIERANLILRKLDIHDSARPSLQALASTLQVNAHLGVLNGREALHLHREIGADAVVVGEIVGWQAPAHCTALGKALLAHLPEEELQARLLAGSLARYTPTTITDAGRLTQEMRRIAADGYAISQEEYHEGIVGIAVAVRDANDDACCAISISVTRPRFDREREVLIGAVQRAADEISKRLNVRRMAPVSERQPKTRHRRNERAAKGG